MRVLTPLRGLGAAAYPLGQRLVVGPNDGDVHALISRSTTIAVPKPPAQSPGELCSSAWATWRLQHLDQAACASDSDAKQTFLSLCNRVQMGALANAQAKDRWGKYVALRCKVAQPAAPPYRRPPTQMPPPGSLNPPSMNSPPLDMPDLPHDGRDPGSSFDPGAGGDAPSTTGARAFLRQVGPVVGIGLLAAIVLTVARKKKLFKRRG